MNTGCPLDTQGELNKNILIVGAVLTACLIGPASPAQGAALTVAQTHRIDVHPGTELALNCGDGTQSGVVQYWHTPFGQLRNHGDRGDLDLDGVAVRSDGGLFAARASERHSGLYYCLLVATGGATLWPYQVNIGKPSSSSSSSSPNPQMVQGDQGRSRPRRDLAGSSGRAEEEQAGVTDGVFAGAVAASVVLSFALGFVTGALSRAHVLRCLEVASRKVRSLRQRRPPGRGFGVSMTTLPDTSKDWVFYEDLDSPRDHRTTVDTTCSSSCMESPPPPAKPQRSFRHNKRREDPQPAADLEGCDPVEEEEEEEVREDERRDGREKEVEERMNGKRKEWEPEVKYVEERVEVRMKEERRESKREEEEQIRDEEQGDREGEPGEEVEERMKERKEGEPEEKYVEERVEVRRESKQEEEEQIRDKEEEGDREGEPEEEVEERMKGRSREGETGEKEVEQLMGERRESREEVEERSGIRGEEGDREGEPGEKEVEERRGNMREEEKEVEERIAEKRESREGEAGVTGEESRVSGDRSPMVIVTKGNSEAGGGGETGRKSEGMAEGKEVVVVVEEQMETASAGEESQKERGVEEEGEISSEDDSSSDTSSSDTEDERKRDEREDGSERVNGNDREGAEEQQEEGTPGSGVTRGRRSRVIRLYQYDDEGHRYSHLPSPAPSELGPTPRLKQRSLSLTRLNAIMTAATAGPMGPNGEMEREECPSPPFSPAPDFKMDF
ncbi:unnamed protein product [Merluccius merluccius]